MQAAGKQPEQGGIGAATRLRLLSLTTPAGRVEFGGGLACIRIRSEVRRAVAEAIARAVIGPRAADVDGTLEVAGRLVELHDLPAPLLRASAASTVDRSLLGEMGRRGRSQRRADVQGAHAARRLERHRTEAEIEQLKGRAERLAARMTMPAIPAAPPEAQPEPEGTPVDAVTPRLEALLESLLALHPVPSAEAIAIADEFEALAASSPPPPAPVDVDLVELERRVAEARVTIAQAAAGVSADARVRIEESQRAVVETERVLFESGRRERPAALFQYQEALDAARAALSEAGVDSYASFLVAIAGGAEPVDLETRLRAELDLAQAEADLDHARELLDQPVEDSLGDEELELRARAALILGRFPAADPAADLRALRVEHPGAPDLRRALQRELDDIGVDAGDDIVATVQSTIDARHMAPPPDPLTPQPPETPAPSVADPGDEGEQRALETEMQTLLESRGAHDAALAALESQLDALDAHAAPASEQILADSVSLALTTMLDCYRSTELLAGRLPLVLDGAFDEIGAHASAVVAHHLAAVDDVQMIIVTSDDEVADAFSRVGATTSSWPDPESAGGEPSWSAPPVSSAPPASSAPPEPPEHVFVDLSAEERAAQPQEAISIVAMCDEHATKVAAASCAHCARGACLECLVYVPTEAELWCVRCAEAAGSTKAPVLGNHG